MLTPRLLAPGRDRRYLAYACGGQHGVEGWLSRSGTILVDLVDAQQREQGVRGGACEIGVHHGRLFVLLALLMRPEEKAVAVDLFDDQHLNVDHSGKGDRAVLERHLARWVGSGSRTVVVQADSTKISGSDVVGWADGPVRLFSIDGGHTAQITLKDLQTAQDSLVQGGAVVLDDVFNVAFPAVSEGLQDYLRDPGRRLVPAVLVGEKTLLVHPESVEDYQARAEFVFTRLGLQAQVHDFVGCKVLALQARPLHERPAFWTGYGRQWLVRHLRR